MEFVTTTRGGRSLIHQGYRYILNRKTADIGRYVGDVQTEVVLEKSLAMRITPNVQILSLQQIYREDTDFKLYIHQVIAISFVPPALLG